jgi:hypothetical protein
VNGNGNLQNSTESATWISLQNTPVQDPESSLPSFLPQSTDNPESFYTDDISLEFDIGSGLGVDYPATSTDTLQFDNDFSQFNFEFPYDLDSVQASWAGFGNLSLEICTVEFDNAQECMFSSPYLTFRYTNPLPGLTPNTAALLARQSPFVATQEARLGGNPLGRNLLLENIRSYLTMFSLPNSFPPFVHHSAFAATDEGKVERSKSEPLIMCHHVAMLYAKNSDTQGSANIWGIVGTEQERMNKFVSDDQ